MIQALQLGREHGPASADEPARILIVDDEAMLRKLVRYVLIGEGYAVAAVDSAAAAFRVLEREAVDLIILDVGMPGTDGLAFCRALREQSRDLPVLFLSARRMLDDTVAGFEAGGDDFLGKPFEPRELAARVRALLNRSHRAAASRRRDALVVGGYTLALPELTLQLPSGEVAALTPTEARVLHCLLLNAGRIVTRDQLVQFAWGEDRDPDHNEIQVYIGRLRRKVEREGFPPCIETVRGLGYRFRGQPLSCTAAS